MAYWRRLSSIARENHSGLLKYKMDTALKTSNIINAFIVGLLLCMLPIQPFKQNIYVTLAIIFFVIFAVVYNLFPQRFISFKYIARACLTQVFAASLGFSFFIALPVSFLDVLPVFIKDQDRRFIFEYIGVVFRAALIFYGFFIMTHPIIALMICLPCYLLSLYECKKHKKKNHGFSYSLEQAGLIVYLFFINMPILSFRQIVISFMLYCLAYLGVFFLMGIGWNIAMYAKRKNLPSWLTPDLVFYFNKKLRANLTSYKLYNYINKPLYFRLLKCSISWQDLMTMVDEIVIDEDFDIGIGVLSGGAFIAPYVCKKNNIPYLNIYNSKCWSGLSLYEIQKKTYQYHAQKEISIVSLEAIGEHYSVAGKKCLLIDDTVHTGTSMRCIKKKLLELGAKEVKTYALLSNENHKPDYYYAVSMVPIIWPWGYEAD